MSAPGVKSLKLLIKLSMEFGICNLEFGEKRFGVAVFKNSKAPCCFMNSIPFFRVSFFSYVSAKAEE